ncbi:hypothetical protein [Leptospira paudalimensis]|uniref:Uncharacterized protein n=1 Tax=Leptospira paudalimensis TaxID=2950024 RepID=A0ABT3M582_9LEPT|nr:hypothetical protein [Leptospira paudalimensis]MCW7503546.1 hypothetical protein [Leptospira paudalimensis]
MKKTLLETKLSFWEQINKSSRKIEKLFHSEQSSQAYEEISKIISKHFPDIFFNISYISKSKEITIAFSPEGEKTKQIIIEYILEEADIPKDWKFYGFKQPSNLEGNAIRMFDISFDSESFMINYQLNDSKSKLNILVFHPEFMKISTEKQRHLSIILIEEILGEALSELFIETIESSEKNLNNSKKYGQFLKEFQLLAQKNNWDLNRNPNDEWSGYSIKEEKVNKKQNYESREDIYVGITRNFNLVDEEIEFYPGTKYIYIKMEIGKLPLESLVNTREKIEDTLLSELKKKKAGDLVGGATGKFFFYSDFLIFDESNAIKIINNILKTKFPEIKYEIHEFRQSK